MEVSQKTHSKSLKTPDSYSQNFVEKKDISCRNLPDGFGEGTAPVAGYRSATAHGSLYRLTLPRAS
jgi:hypothetical protein